MGKTLFERMAEAQSPAMTDAQPTEVVELLPCVIADEDLEPFAVKIAEVAAVPGGNGMISLNMADAGKLAEAYLARTPPVSDGWQPIETFSDEQFVTGFANSTWFLVVTSDGRVTEGEPFILEGGKRLWICSRGSNCSDPRWPAEYLWTIVTHWRPLPPPPVSEGVGL